MGGGRLLFNQTLHTLFGRPVEQRFGSTPRAILKDARRGSLPPPQTLHERIDGGSGAVEGPGDLGGREAVGGEQGYAHPDPSGRFGLSLHLWDEVLAVRGCEGDTFHRRLSLWWLGRFGVFTMPQEEMAVCSIILCIYLERNSLRSLEGGLPLRFVLSNSLS